MVMNTDGAKTVGELAARTWVRAGRGWVVRVTAGTGWGGGEWSGREHGEGVTWAGGALLGGKSLRGLGRPEQGGGGGGAWSQVRDTGDHAVGQVCHTGPGVAS